MTRPQPVTLSGLYDLDAADADLSLLPMAARRALDVAGSHLTLKGWQRSSFEQRCELVRLGAAEQVDVARVHDCLRDLASDVRAEPALVEPAASEGPPPLLLQALTDARPLDSTQWRALRALDRYVLLQLARRNKLERLAQAYGEIMTNTPSARAVER